MVYSIILSLVILIFSSCGALQTWANELPTPSTANPHYVGWGNLLIPGLGETLNGNTQAGLHQAGYEIGSFALGYKISPRSGVSSLDGINDRFQTYSKSRRIDQTSINSQMYSDMLLEFSIKTHMTNTFVAYRDAFRAQGITEGIDQRTWWEGFKTPFLKRSFEDPWVYLPILAIAAGVTADYLSSKPSDSLTAFTPTSNALYATHYGLWEPLGSGWPEEAFYRGFLQREFTLATGSPIMGILGESAAFAFSHQAGNGRWSAVLVGLYLGYLAQRNNGNLGPGITVHFWGDLLLGLETILISHRNQRTTPQTALGVQFNY